MVHLWVQSYNVVLMVHLWAKLHYSFNCTLWLLIYNKFLMVHLWVRYNIGNGTPVVAKLQYSFNGAPVVATL